MTLDLNNLSFGQYLKSARLQSGVELEVIAKETRIGMENLRHIESEAHDLLPAAAFVKGFLRAYAQALGIDPEDVVQRYEDSLEREKIQAQGEAELVRMNQRFWSRLIMSLSALVILMVLSISIISVSKNPLMRIQSHDVAKEKVQSSEPALGENDSPEIQAVPDESNAAPPVKDEPVASQESPFKTSEQESEPSTSESTLPPERGQVLGPELGDVPLSAPETQYPENRLRLEINAHEETWLQATIDDRAPKSYHLRPGSNLELEAATNFTLRVGNAGGVTLFMDDLQLPPLGRSGQVVTIRLP